ncbi:hypothetical protein JR316_0010480 [Psilocybe cubensis]|uniref:Uncharacterized protein n=2 Tax=Psilocybe cubensis TaxID=181762 RepID=A0ACB8GLJ2_PSICU|nr:hypothetical protein JR316_0010480 [Psilocybe cubensis]KAH9476568.1 hypothetical protein JR316_0010480 [Psilocybe cubensis]
MASNGGHQQEYDAALLASAPAATKAQLQSGYNPDLLVEKPSTPTQQGSDLEAALPPTANPTHTTANAHRMQQRQPFYRTRKGIVIIVIALVVVIAAAVGGGVGGSKKKHGSDAVVAPTGPDDGGNGNGSGAPPQVSSDGSSSSTTGTGTGTGTSTSTSAGTGASQGVGDPNAPQPQPGPSQGATPTQGGVIGRPTESAATAVAGAVGTGTDANAVGQLVGGST